MASHTESKTGSPWLRVIAGAVLIVLGATVLYKVYVPVPGLPLSLGKTASMLGILLVLFPVVRHFYTGPLEEAISERNSSLERTFTEAEELRARMDSMRSEYETRLAETEAQAREQIQAQIRQAQDLRAEMMAEATAKADSLVKRAQEEIEQQKARALTEMRLEVVNLTLAATERILGENVDDARNRKLVQEFIDTVEVPS